MKKGFTLIELLAVIVILAIIALIATPIVLNIINDSKESSVLRSADFYLDGVEIVISQKMLDSKNIQDGTYDIIKDGNICLEYDLDNKCTDILKVEVDGEVPASGLVTIISGQISQVSLTYNNKTIIKNIKGELLYSPCKLLEDNEDVGISPGDKYQCKVKDNMETGFEDGYYFYVLSTNEDGTVNLIMDRNIYYDEVNDVGKVATEANKGVVAWYADAGDSGFGPVTAMNYLHSATKDWSNIPNIKVNYIDEGNTYGNIKTTVNTTVITKKDTTTVTVTYENLKARLPNYSEVHGEGKCLRKAENNDEYGSCPLWLANNLSKSDYLTGKNYTNVPGIYAYWTLSSYGGELVWQVNYNGNMAIDGTRVSTTYGVRPVIALEI